MSGVIAGGIDTYTPELKVRELSDGEFIFTPDVPIFDEHNGADEGLDIIFTPEVLQQICDNTNLRIADTGDMPPIYVGHIDDDKPESEQGELLGFVARLHLGTIGEVNPRACILADIKWKRDRYELSKEFPRRSAELWLDDFVIDILSVLKRRPQRDLGILFQKDKKNSLAKAKYSRLFEKEQMSEANKTTEPQASPEWVKQVLEHLMATPEMKYVKDCMSKSCEEVKDEDEEVDVKVDEADEEEDDKPEKLKAQRNQSRRQYAKLLESHKTLEGRLANMEKEALVAKRKADLLELEAEGIVFDIGEELEYVSDLDSVKYQKHMNKMKKNYSKAPINVKIEQAKIDKPGGATPDSVYAKLKTPTLKTHDMLGGK